jgi:hypothetical protein
MLSHFPGDKSGAQPASLLYYIYIHTILLLTRCAVFSQKCLLYCSCTDWQVGQHRTCAVRGVLFNLARYSSGMNHSWKQSVLSAVVGPKNQPLAFTNP